VLDVEHTWSVHGNGMVMYIAQQIDSELYQCGQLNPKPDTEQEKTVEKQNIQALLANGHSQWNRIVLRLVLALEQSLVLGRKQFNVHNCFHDDNYFSMIRKKKKKKKL
jgi:hypothetical protein